MQPNVESFFDPVTSTFSHIIYRGSGTACAVIDPVRDYDDNSARTGHTLANTIINFIQQHELKLQWLLETHIHADHLSASSYLRERLGGKIATSAAISKVSEIFGDIFNFTVPESDPCQHFDHLFTPDEVFYIGDMRAVAMHVPGHTQADMAFYIEDAVVFVGDTLFAPDVGTARCDFPGGSAKQLWQSIQKLLALPQSTRTFLCHDYPPPGRGPRCEFTVGQQRAHNIHMADNISETQFVHFREQRDKQLRLPQLLVPSLQANLRAGALPPAEANGISYMKVPLNIF